MYSEEGKYLLSAKIPFIGKRKRQKEGYPKKPTFNRSLHELVHYERTLFNEFEGIATPGCCLFYPILFDRKSSCVAQSL